jgi:hypothetical protein
MSERPLLEALAELAREQQELEREDPELVAWQKGQLSPEQSALLEQRSEPRDAALFQPVSPDRKEELARSVREQLGAPAESPRDNVVRLPHRRWPWLVTIAASVAVVFFGRNFFVSPDQPHLPPFALAISSGAVNDRIEAPPANVVPTFAPNTTLQLILRPEKEVSGEVAFRAFLVRGDRWIEWSPPFALDVSGSIVIEGQTSELLRVDPGEWTLVFVLARPAEVDAAAKQVAGRSRDRPASSIVLEQKIIVAE